MKDGSDAVADWPLLNAMLNTASGASWVSIHNGGGVGIGYSQHAGQVTVADGTDAMAKRIERVLTKRQAQRPKLQVVDLLVAPERGELRRFRGHEQLEHESAARVVVQIL